jgi:hypothetical protein
LEDGACSAVKNIGKPCAGKPHARFDEGGPAKAAKVWLLRHRQTKGAETDRPDLKSSEPALYSTPVHYFEYKASSKACMECLIKDKCTRSESGRTLKRHARQNELDEIIKKTKSRESKNDLKTRQHLSERSFAQSIQYGFKRARWRTLWRMEIQDFLIATIQNIKVLVKQPKERMSKINEQIFQKIGEQYVKARELSLVSLLEWIFPKRLCFSLS